MKKLIFVAFALALFLGKSPEALAAYPLTKSAHFVAASSQYLTAAESSSLTVAAGNFTVESWVYFNSVPSGAGDTRYTMASKGNLATFAGEMAFEFARLSSVNELLLYYSNGSSAAQTSVVSWTPTVSTWYHVAVTHDTSGNVKFYVNAVQQGSTQTGSPGTSVNSGVAWAIGSYTTGTYGNFIDANISLMRYWNVVRVASDFSTNQCSVLGATTNLKAEWRLDNSVSPNTGLDDDSGNSNTLTNNGTVTWTAIVPSAACTPASSFNFGDWFGF